MRKTQNVPAKSGRRDVFFRLMKYFLRYKGRVAVALLLMLGSNAFALIGPWLSGEAVDALAAPGGVDFAAVGRYCAYMAVFYVISGVLSYALTLLMIRLSQRIVRSMRQDVFDKFLVMPLSLLDRMQTGDLINRISYDIDTVNASLSNDILQAATSVVTVVGALIGMIAASPILLAVFLVTVPLSVFIALKRSRQVRPLFRRRSAKLAELNGFSEEMLTGLATIRAYGREQKMIEKFRIKNTEAVDAYYEADYYGSLIGPAVNFVNNLGTVIISTAGAFLYLFGLIGLGSISGSPAPSTNMPTFWARSSRHSPPRSACSVCSTRPPRRRTPPMRCRRKTCRARSPSSMSAFPTTARRTPFTTSPSPPFPGRRSPSSGRRARERRRSST